MKTKTSIFTGLILVSLVAFLCLANHAASGSVVKVVKKAGGGFELQRDGKPYLIRGAGGGGSKTALKAAGANSYRTWGADNLDAELAEAQKLGLTVTVGIWLGHKEHGFHYDDAAAVAAQKESARKDILRYRDSPALLLWGLGNEMETGQEDNVDMWNAIEDIAKMAHQLDPNHPTMTVVAELGGDKVKRINELCPDIDVVGINTYGGGPSIGDRYRAAGGVKPYVITEFGPPGTWESGKNAWGVVPELTSTEKAARYRATYEKAVLGQPLALGSYAFTWGNKQEATTTWFGLLLPDGSRLGAVDALSELWTDKKPANLCPDINALKAAGPDQVAPGTIVKATLDATDPEHDPLTVKWLLQVDPATYNTGGGGESVPPSYPEAIIASDSKSAQVKMPKFAGAYRLYAYVHDDHGGAAVANIPLKVSGGDTAPPPAARQAALPLSVYGETGGDAPFIPAGFMGNTAAIKMDVASTVSPHSGKTCLKVEYTASDNWGGVVWQSPADDWGDKPGGWNLTGARKLTFWARGDKGGEKVGFLYGLIGNDKTYHDSSTGKLEGVVLTKDWKQYSIDLAGKNLSQIKTGFAWTLASTGQPITFYLDDIRYEGAAGGADPVPVVALAPKATLPLVVYAEGDRANPPYVPSGYMGNAGAIKMDEKSTASPHAGKTCLKVDYTASDNWGGVVWQSPLNDWGDKPGGWNLTGAKKLTFWAKGDKGGEVVTFLFGLIAIDKAYHDSATGKLDKVALTKDWKQYTIDLAGKDLSQIKTGFAWTLASTGRPITFYLDDVKFE